MIDELKARGSYILVDRYKSEDERGGLKIPDVAKRKPQRGLILSVGKLVADRTIKAGQVAYWHQTAGFEMEIEREVVFVLREQDVIACIDENKK